MNEFRVLSCVDRNLHRGFIELDRAGLVFKSLSAGFACPMLYAAFFAAGLSFCRDMLDIIMGGELGNGAFVQRGLLRACLVTIIPLADRAVVILNIALLGAGGVGSLGHYEVCSSHSGGLTLSVAVSLRTKPRAIKYLT